jgi:hypothetical protein
VSRFLLVVALAGCGRIGFELPTDASSTPWTLIQTAATQSLTLRLVPVGAQHLVVVAVQITDPGVAVTLTDDSGCNTYAPIAGARSFNANEGDELRLFYAKNTCAGAQTIDIDTTSSITVVAWEVAGIRTDDPLDTASVLNDQPATTMPLGPRITTSTAGEFIVAVAIVTNTVTGVVAGNEFTNDHLTNGNAWAHLTDAMAPAGAYQARWNQPMSGTYCASAAAFKVGR